MGTKPEAQKWLLISEETIHEIKQALVNAPQETVNEVVYLINIGLHITDAVPDDFKDEAPKA